MMGKRTVAQEVLFYSFNLERHVPADLASRRQRKKVKLIPMPANPEPPHGEQARARHDPSTGFSTQSARNSR